MINAIAANIGGSHLGISRSNIKKKDGGGGGEGGGGENVWG